MCTVIDVNAYFAIGVKCVTCDFAFIALIPLFARIDLALHALQRRLCH